MIQLWCLHGFLQDGSVWKSIARDLKQRVGSPNIRVQTPTIIAENQDSLDAWSTRFCRMIASSGSGKNVLLGYSMGGRLAMQAFVRQPELFETAVFVSAHPGIADPALRSAANDRDKHWAARFEREPLSEVLRDWDSQSVFAGSAATDRPEIDVEQAANQLRRFSKGRQRDLREDLAVLQRRFTYMSGSRDKKYVEIGRQLAETNDLCEHVIINNAGHRVVWDNQSEFKSRLFEILAT